MTSPISLNACNALARFLKAGVNFSGELPNWTAKQLPIAELLLTPCDVNRPGIPTPLFIHKTASIISHEGFTYIPNLKDVISDLEQAKTFHKCFITMLANYISKRAPDLISPKHRVELYNRDEIVTERYPRYAYVHFDGDKTPLNSILYHGFSNLNGGMPRMANLRRFMKDKNKTMDEIMPKSTPTRWYALDHLELPNNFSDDYGITLSNIDPSTGLVIVTFINDRKNYRILHGRERFSQIDKSIPGRRILDFASIENC